MAIYRLQLTKGKAGTGGAHFDYIARQGKYRIRESEQFVAQGSGNLPSWAGGDARKYWKTGDIYERKNGNAYRGFTLTLPHELSDAANIELVKRFVQEIAGTNHAFSYALHSVPSSVEGIRNIHAHVMIDFRLQDGIERRPEKFFKQYYAKDPAKSGCRKVDPYNRKGGTSQKAAAAVLKKTRELWRDLQNRQLERYGFSSRVNHLPLGEKRLLSEENTAFRYFQRRGEVSEFSRKNQQIRADNAAVKKIDRQLDQLQQQKALIKETAQLEKKLEERFDQQREDAVRRRRRDDEQAARDIERYLERNR